MDMRRQFCGDSRFVLGFFWRKDRFIGCRKIVLISDRREISVLEVSMLWISWRSLLGLWNGIVLTFRAKILMVFVGLGNVIFTKRGC